MQGFWLKNTLVIPEIDWPEALTRLPIFIREYIYPKALRMAELLQDPRFENREIVDKLSKLSGELSEKLQAIKRDPLDAAIKHDLHAIAKTLRHDPDLRDGLRTLNPEASKEIDRLIKEQQRHLDRGR